MSSDTPDLPKLKPREQSFVDHYCGAGDGAALLNAKLAAIKAGYSERTAHGHSHRMLKNVDIHAHIEHHFASQALSRNQVLALVAADASLSDDEILQQSQRFKSEITGSSYVSGKMAARTTARTNLLKAHGVFTENVNVTGGIDINIVGVDTEKL